MAKFYFRHIFVSFACMWFAHAHTAIYNFVVDNQKLAMKKYIRPFYEPYNFPVKYVNSQDLVCRTSDMSSTNTETCDVTAGSTVGVVFKADGSPESIVFDRSHKGPCLVYMAPMESNGKGDVWFKTFEEGYDKATNQWCSEHVIDANGKLDIPLPADIANGEYLLRAEIIALHTAFDVGGAEFYANCVQIRVGGGGSAKPKGVSIPGVYNPEDPGIHFNIYKEFNSYNIPGPKVYVTGSSIDDTERNTVKEPDALNSNKDYNPRFSESSSDTKADPTSYSAPQPRCRESRRR